MTIVSVLDLTDYMSGIDLKVHYGQENAAEMVLAGVQGEIEAYINRPLEPVTVTETLTFDPWTNELSEPRVTPIISVSTDGWTLLNGRLVPPGGINGWFPSILEYINVNGYAVTYVAGLDGANIPHIRLEIMRIAAREMSNKHDDTVGLNAGQLVRGAISLAPEALNEEDRLRLDRYRRRSVC